MVGQADKVLTTFQNKTLNFENFPKIRFLLTTECCPFFLFTQEVDDEREQFLSYR